MNYQPEGMEMRQLRSWAVEGPVSSPFAFPEGRRGRWAGRVMSLTNPQREIAALVANGRDDRVLEVGYGPGRLVALLARAGTVYGVDPSPEMRILATARNRRKSRAGRVDLRLGTADATGFPDDYFDAVVSVNNVALWPDLEAGLRELDRVLKPGGQLVIAWHGGTRPSWITRRLRLPEPMLFRLYDALSSLFSKVDRHELRGSTVFRATR
ncbi:class I SAM-dependent methyltransferase [Acrocarpospora macrocephala]|nr:class I SAM-dependent methyltransferase [Acrocarpospora macrocephala]